MGRLDATLTAFARAIEKTGPIRATREEVAAHWPAFSDNEITQFMEMGEPTWDRVHPCDTDEGGDEDAPFYATMQFNLLGNRVFENNPAYRNLVSPDWRDHVHEYRNPQD